MKKAVIFITIIVFSMSIIGCGNDMAYDGKVYGTYGLINKSEMRNHDVEYRLIIGNVVWGILLIETIVFPIYFFGFSIYEPVGPSEYVEKGVIRKYTQ